MDCESEQKRFLDFARKNRALTSRLLAVLNVTRVPGNAYRIGLPQSGYWREVLNSDSEAYGGGNLGNLGGVTAENYKVHNQPFSAAFFLPPLSVTVFRPDST